ncbi:MAG: DUF479 domain-containing protein [Taibaiella sp.]|nr:DUF479 domain-containing protein [Taibaiella sp.]
MNYLAHAFLSGREPEILVGNMMGDFVKGSSILDRYPPKIRQGLELHRSIDVFTDGHRATAKAKNYFRNDYGLYSGAFVDVMYDHFLSNDPKFFPQDEQLRGLHNRRYSGSFISTSFILPPDFAHMLQYMEKDNWLYQIRSLKGLETGMNRLVRRMTYEHDGRKAYETTVRYY